MAYVFYWFLGMALLIGVLLLSFAASSRPQLPGWRFYLLKRDVRATGTITALEHSGLDLLKRHPVVRFQTPQGEWLNLCCREISLSLDVKVGQQVEIRYPANSPQDFIVVSGLDLLFN